MINSICHICQHSGLSYISNPFNISVSSDCKRVTETVDFAICDVCKTVQKVKTPNYIEKCKSIYKNYSVYHQGGGNEQKVFSDSNACNRSEKIIKNILRQELIPEKGRLLDIGCGNGSFLKSFNKTFSAWSLYGAEYDNKHKKAILEIPGVNDFFSCSLDKINQKFDLIVMIHTLEHIISPINFLIKLKDLLKPDAYVLLEIPNIESNPFDLLIYDHCSHFSVTSLNYVLSRSLFKIIEIQKDTIPKELTILAKNDVNSSKNDINVKGEVNIEEELLWLESIERQVRELSNEKTRLGIFGTSISANWLDGMIDVDFFVDEDKNRIGYLLNEKPILPISEVDFEDNLYLPFPHEIAVSLKQRLKLEGVRGNIIIPESLKKVI